MELLSTVHTMSIAELRKILKDNNVQETSSSKEQLIHQVGEVLLTNMMIQETTRVTEEKYPKTIERELQDEEYRKALFLDEYGNMPIKEVKQMDQFTQEPIFEELSPKSLREARVSYYNNHY
jgi:hypothetical protein